MCIRDSDLLSTRDALGPCGTQDLDPSLVRVDRQWHSHLEERCCRGEGSKHACAELRYRWWLA
eukprot:9387802-Alexandrium_andersonii.AAC.1